MKAHLKKIGLVVALLLTTLSIWSQDSTAVAADSLKAATSATATTVTPTIDSGDTAWMIVAAAFVLMMTIPGLALFYGGLVRRKNVINVLMQCFIITGLITVEWVVVGYSMAFGSSEGWLKPFIGGFDWAFLKGINISDLSPYFISHSQATADGGTIGTIPHLVFVLFQGMFAIITPALIVGAYAERIKFGGFALFTLLWALLVYNPIAHWVWSGDGWLFKMGALDFAGGTVVHINAGIAALVTAIMIGKRKYYEGHPNPPHNIPYVLIGASLLWIGWIGFNAGSGLAADGLAASAFLVTHLATATAAVTWAALDWIFNKKPTLVGAATGAVAGLVAITPAAGFVDVTGALIIGLLVPVFCYIAVGIIKPRLGYDDSLDAFGVHGIGGIWGAIATGLLATPAIQSYQGLFYGNPAQLWIQVKAVLATLIYSGVVTFILFWITDKLVGVRATDSEETEGLDLSQHGETAYSKAD
ncbi:MAG: ammonium transporter [Bacteroidales bacterium]|nr:ammonium transporter [Bacteroidales bacterium]